MKLTVFVVSNFELYYWMCDGKIVAIQDPDEVCVDVIFIVKYCNFNNPTFMQFDNSIVKFDFSSYLSEYLENLIEDDCGSDLDDFEVELFIKHLRDSLV